MSGDDVLVQPEELVETLEGVVAQRGGEALIEAGSVAPDAQDNIIEQEAVRPANAARVEVGLLPWACSIACYGPRWYGAARSVSSIRCLTLASDAGSPPSRCATSSAPCHSSIASVGASRAIARSAARSRYSRAFGRSSLRLK